MKREFYNSFKDKLSKAARLLEEAGRDLEKASGSASAQEIINQKYVHYDDFCETFRITKATFWNWEKVGKVHPKVLGRGKVYVEKTELERLLNAS